VWAPPPPPDEELLRVAVISDLNGSYGSMRYGPSVHRAVKRVIELDPDVVISPGDMVAGQKEGLDYAGMWRAFHRAVSDKLFDAGIPFAPSPGNHDASAYPRHAIERVHYKRAWQYRKPDVPLVDTKHMPFRYAFVMKDTLFVSLDATMARRMKPAHFAWLDALLTKHADVKTKIVYGHLPLYPFARGREGDILNDPKLEAMLNRHGVDLFVSGHHQVYYPGRRGELRMLSVGCLGGGVRDLLNGEPSMRVITMIEIDSHGIRSIEGYTGDNFDERVPRGTLPFTLGWSPMAIWRDDVGAPAYMVKRLELLAREESLKRE